MSKCATHQVRGFTLIEVLVVVAIIALLIAILLPSLKAARVQAKIAIDQANAKQIGSMGSLYQADFRGYVPVVFNYYANGIGQHSAPARACWLSVALRRYSQSTARLGGPGDEFDPNAVWSNDTRKKYERTKMPAFYACPFERDKGPEWDITGRIGVYTLWNRGGRFESYQTWLWEDIVRGLSSVHGEPLVTPKDKPKYTVFSWNLVRVNGRFPDGTQITSPGPYSAGTMVTDPSKHAYRQWTDGDVRRMRSGSLSETTVSYCAQGEHMLLGVGRANVGSHSRGGVGGTNAIFADTHVEWVQGTRIGWP